MIIDEVKENTVTVTLNDDCINSYSQYNKPYVRQEPYVNEEGIYVPVHEYVQEDCVSVYRCVMTKDMFVEAYNKYIKPKNQRIYKGGWKH